MQASREVFLKPLLFIALLLAPIFTNQKQAAAASPATCDDAHVQAVFKTERERDVSSLCRLADKSRYGQIEFKNSNGQTESISCCRNDYEAMQISAELHAEEKKQFCAEVRSGAASLKGGNGEEFLEERISLSEKSEEKIASLRQKLANCLDIGAQCKAVMNAANSTIEGELARSASLIQSAKTEEERNRIKNAVTIQVRR